MKITATPNLPETVTITMTGKDAMYLKKLHGRFSVPSLEKHMNKSDSSTGTGNEYSVEEIRNISFTSSDFYGRLSEVIK